MVRTLYAAVIGMALCVSTLTAGEAAKLPDGLYIAFQTTKGRIVASLEMEKTPITVINLVGLAEGTKQSNKEKGARFYDGLTFHRVEPGFVIQGGCPDGTGSGGPGYQFPNEIEPSLKHDAAGILSMANAGPGTNGSQFFITLGATPHLDGLHTVFGHVVSGMDVVQKIVKGDVMEKVEIIRQGAAAKAFTATQKDFEMAHLRRAMRKSQEFQQMLAAKLDSVQESEGGALYIVAEAGSGKTKPTAGRNVSIHVMPRTASGMPLGPDRGPAVVDIGNPQLPAQWSEMLLAMTEGEKRLIIDCVPNLPDGVVVVELSLLEILPEAPAKTEDDGQLKLTPVPAR